VQPGYTASAGLQQLLFDFNHTRDLVRQASQFERAAGANLTRVQQDLALQVKQAFYAYVQAESLVGVNENNVRNRQGHIDLAQARLRAGLGPPIDVVRAQTAQSEAVGTLESARNTASQARVDLALLMGIDPRTPIVAADSDEPEPATTDVNQLSDEAMKQRPEIAQVAAVLRAFEHGVSAASTLNAPALRASAVVVGRGQSLLPRNEFLTLGLGIQWDPFDGGRTAGRVREARASVETARADLNRMQQLVISDVSRAFLDLKTAEQRVTAADAGVANAQEAVRLAEGRYRAGLGLFLDVMDSQSALLAARTSRVNAQSSVDQARAALKRAVGAR
jgi:outer membrane protein